MVQIAIPHLIGTVTLITIFFFVGAYFQNVYTYVQTESSAHKLRETANNIASNIVDLISLCFLSDVDQNLNRTIDVPTDIFNSIYSIEIYTYSDPIMKEDFYIVRAYLTLNPSIHGQSELPWTGDGILNIDPATSSISAGAGNLVIWCKKIGNNITIGFR